MAKVKMLSILLIFCLLFSLVFPMTKAYAESESVVTLNFEGGVIHDGYVEYNGIGKLQLFKGDDLVADISNNMVIDLNEAEYKFVIEEIEDKGSASSAITPIKLNINDWYYPMTTIEGETKSTFKLESSKFGETLDVKLVRTRTVVNTKVEKIYKDVTAKETFDLTDGKEYVIDFSKDDELTEGLKTFARLGKTLYYKNVNNTLVPTENENEAIIKIEGNLDENKAILTAINVGTKKSDVLKGLYTNYTGSSLKFDNSVGGIINETRTDYYNNCTYDFTFQYVKEEVSTKEYKFIEGANQTYTIDESKNATFKIDADYSLFTNKVYVDNKLVDSANYDSKSGSTVITLKDEYLKTLSVGEHTLKVAFSDNGEAITKFTIKEKQKDTNIEDNKNNENTKNDENQENNNLPNNDVKKDNTITNTNPKTGDNVIVYFVMFSIAILGIVTLVIVNNKKSKKERKH